MDDCRRQWKKILKMCKDNDVQPDDIQSVQTFLHSIECGKLKRIKRILKIVLVVGIVLCCLQYYVDELQSKGCSLRVPSFAQYAFRPPEDCKFCRNVDTIDRVVGISRKDFESKYAYTGRPAIVEDATKNWTALSTFSYEYFRNIYHQATRKSRILDCQFLPYKTGFKDIFEALDMSKDRVDLQPGSDPWYFGWSNCNSETAEEFRKHYGSPYFLPENSENNDVDWFFIGTAGLGAHMHIDNVRLPSWQAQLSGNKRWLLAPPPECYFQCKEFEVVVKKGDIIVLDTNKWYHQTFVQPGEVSLTIGAEYD